MLLSRLTSRRKIFIFGEIVAEWGNIQKYRDK